MSENGQTAEDDYGDPDCPACTGRTEGELFDLCDDHLYLAIAPALAENDAARAAALTDGTPR